MSKKMTHSDCFAAYGTVPRNLRWSWSGRSRDGKVVSVTFWQDLFEDGGRIYRSSAHSSEDRWYGSPGHKELVENMQHAWDHCDGELKIIIAIAKDPKAAPRSIRECFPAINLKMRLREFDSKTGDFVVERI
ncbi:MAG TPA: hypothetical protein PKA55_08495 [Rhodoblastus sp.]|nr:hypothetical protein [Rhodoblastus sp.]